MKQVILDIETDALDASVIHLAIAKPLNEPNWFIFGGPHSIQDNVNHHSLDRLPKYLMSCDKIIMHNGMSFDLPTINRLLGCDIPYSKVLDTLILSYLYNPNQHGGHSLSSWGEQLGYHKLVQEDFSSWTPELEDYCRRDVEITEKLLNYFTKEIHLFSKRSVNLEHTIRRVLDMQQDNGFYLDQAKCHILLSSLQDEAGTIHDHMVDTFEPTIEVLKTKTKEIPFNPQSRQQIGDRLIKRGWEPKLFTGKTKLPVVNEQTLSDCDVPEAKELRRYMLLRKRISQITSWINEVKDDGRVHGNVITIGAVTNRMTHNKPNMAQIPAIYSPYGKECRECWTVEDKENYRLVGADSSGLELRCLAHYIDDAKYTKEILEGDIHTANQKMAGLDTRDQAKTFIYAFLYGAGAAKIGSIIDKDAAQGQLMIDRFLDRMPKLAQWRTRVMAEAEGEGNVRALDGRYLRVRSPHSSVNTLLQGMGAIVCKEWLSQIMILIKEKGIDAKPVANIHDEVQFEVHKKDAEFFSKLTKEATKITQESLNVKCPLDSEAKIGTTWAETH